MPEESAGADTVLGARGVNKRFGDTHALVGCNFSARAGEIHALVGENGSGKSTLAKVLSGIFQPDSGEIDVLGGRPRSPADAMSLGLATVFQEILVCEGQSVLDNLFIGTDGTWRRSASTDEKVARAEEKLAELVPETINLHARIESLPLNQRQWITIARALLRNPRVLILDEATAALDLAGAEALFANMKQLRDAGSCVLVVTHRIAELTSFADRATVLRDGTTVGTIDRDEISEERLLQMMSGEQAAQRRTQVRATDSGKAVVGPIVSARNVCLRPGSDTFDLDIAPGEIIGVIGLDGHGQDTFIRAVAGIVPPLDGEIVVTKVEANTPIPIVDERAAARQGIAYIPGDRKLEGTFPNLSILENFGAGLFATESTLGVIRSRRISRAYRKLAEALSVKASAPTAPIGTLSGGNQQKILIARALATEPRVVVLNDPTRGVDISTKHDLYELLERLASERRAIVFLSSEIEEFLDLCDRVAVFRNGSLFRILPAVDLSIDSVLAAMFGRSSEEDFTMAGDA